MWLWLNLFTYWLAEQRSPVLAVGVILLQRVLLDFSWRTTRTLTFQLSPPSICVASRLLVHVPMALASNLATLVAVGNGHLLEYIFPYLGCCDQLSSFSMARFIHIEARPVLLREPWIAFHCAVCSEVKRRFYDRCIRRAPKAFGWS